MGWGMKQLTLATAVFERYTKTTRRAAFLAEMERVVPWSALCKLIELFYPKQETAFISPNIPCFRVGGQAPP